MYTPGPPQPMEKEWGSWGPGIWETGRHKFDYLGGPRPVLPILCDPMPAKKKEKRQNDKIVPWEEKVDKENKENDKDKEREGRSTLAALMESGCCAACPTIWCGSLQKPRRPAFQPTDRPSGRRFARSKGECLGGTVPQKLFPTPVFHSLLSRLCFHACPGDLD